MRAAPISAEVGSPVGMRVGWSPMPAMAVRRRAEQVVGVANGSGRDGRGWLPLAGIARVDIRV